MAEEGTATVVASDDVVSLEYILRYEDGDIAASSDEDGLLHFIQGHEHVFPVLEKAVEGMRVGDEAELILPPEDTYGPYNPDARELLPWDLFPSDVEVVEGLEVELLDEESGAVMDAVVIDIGEEGIEVDLNHPLASETLAMWFRVAGIRPATDEELAHDHVHEDDDSHSGNQD